MATPLEQLEAMRSLKANWDGYNADPPLPGPIDLGKAFVQLLDAVRRDVEVSPELYVTPTRVGGVMIVWEDREFEYELEIEPDGSFGLLSQSKSTKQIEVTPLFPGPGPIIIRGH